MCKLMLNIVMVMIIFVMFPLYSYADGGDVQVRSSGSCTSKVNIDQVTSTQAITGVASQFIHICSVVLVSATAQLVSVVEGTGAICATGIQGLMGGTSASMSFAANGGVASVSGVPWLRTQVVADNVCVLQSGAGNVSGVITYISKP